MHTNSSGPIRSVGEFLANHPVVVPTVYVDRVELADLKQDAALRVILAFRKLGLTLTDDAVASFNEQPRLCAQVFRWALRDAQRRAFGQQHRLMFLSELSRTETMLAHTQTEHDPLIDADTDPRLLDLRAGRLPGLTPELSQTVISTMRDVQRLRHGGQTRVPDHLRKRLSRLRTQTGLPLDSTLL